MCGILVYNERPANLDFLQAEIKNRGPDHCGKICANGLTFESSVLSLRKPFTPQPLADDDGVLGFNGEIYGKAETQDTLLFRETIKRSVKDVFKLEGEFAFVYLDRKENVLYFGRDSCGRRSLCYLQCGSQLVISSVGDNGYTECDGGVLYSFKLANSELRIEGAPHFMVSRALDGPQRTDDLYSALLSACEKRLARASGERIALLFSGGLDCTLLAAFLDKCVDENEPIELLNVAFENRRTSNSTLYETPDRLLARRTVATCLNKRFVLREINISYEEYQRHRARVQRLMLPTATVMDLSIALAFYFATKPLEQDSPRIIFSGLGADELFAGYSRHTSVSSDPEKLAAELELDFLRLPHRNLGRDDRVVSSWGREMRYPFLDSGVVSLASELPLSLKTDGVETKRVLRSLAQSMGLESVVHEKKRAIQFGARSAKMDPGSGSSKGHELLRGQ